jgi:hypothetical protein
MRAGLIVLNENPNNVNDFIQSKVFTVHLFITNFGSVHQHVANITEHDEAWVLI